MAPASKLVHVVGGVALAATLGMFACRSQAPVSASKSAGDGGAALAFTPEPTETPTGKLVAFASDGDFDEWMESWRDRERTKHEARRPPFPMNAPKLDGGAPPVNLDDGQDQMASGAAPAPPAAAPKAAKSESRAAAGKADSITNNQHANVDEGDIVKLHGDHLIVLRRGRLFTVNVKSPQPAPSAMHDAFGPNIDPRGTWYDEMLVEGDNVVVVGFSYARGGTEVGLFRIDAAGSLQYRATYHLRSNDYYSARNYASRIVDGHLVFYAPTYLTATDTRESQNWPAMRQWRTGAASKDFVRTLPAPRLFHLEGELPPTSQSAMHTVTSCDLASPQLTCESVGLLGPPGRVFYVSETSVYVWMREWSNLEGQTKAPGLLAKIPLQKGASPTAIRVGGMPTDQFSFDEADGFLHVMVRSESNGDAMFESESTAGRAALLRVPLGLFSQGVPVAANSRYRNLPAPGEGSLQNRFVGSWLLYGTGNGYWQQKPGTTKLYATRVASKEAPQEIALDQGVDRIEPMGEHAVVVGSRGSDLVFSPVELGAERARANRDYVRKNASQGELRSHGFFYKNTATKAGHTQGLVGLPIRGEGARGSRYLTEGSASVLFLAEKDLELTELGSLEAGALRTVADGCRASCVDWYGNARPIFLGNRVFALMGYELVEGNVVKARLHEKSRLDFAPHGAEPQAWAEE